MEIKNSRQQGGRSLSHNQRRRSGGSDIFPPTVDSKLPPSLELGWGSDAKPKVLRGDKPAGPIGPTESTRSNLVEPFVGQREKKKSKQILCKTRVQVVVAHEK